MKSVGKGFDPVVKQLQELRELVEAKDLSKKKNFQKFILARNKFRDSLALLNEELYKKEDAVIIPELLVVDEAPAGLAIIVTLADEGTSDDLERSIGVIEEALSQADIPLTSIEVVR